MVCGGQTSGPGQQWEAMGSGSKGQSENPEAPALANLSAPP